MQPDILPYPEWVKIENRDPTSRLICKEIPMNQQNALFPEMQEGSPATKPHGFHYQDEIITEAEQATLLASLQQLDLRPFEFHG
ncbi:MAG TPA: hypothetical protein VE195_10210, partial [Acidobacteriaceae bacterium]|nr:hypothetical protein [Acidobacteriaceae bacterium]